MVDVPTDANLASFISNHQGETITVPGTTYNVSSSLQVSGGTDIVFTGTHLSPPNTTWFNLFSTSGSGWSVSGPCTIDGTNCWVRLGIFGGSGQLGAAPDRIEIQGHPPSSSVQDSYSGVSNREKDEYRMFMFNGNGSITLENITHPGGPPGVGSGMSCTWSQFDGPLTFRGCDFRNTGSNGFYVKPMGGTFTAEDCYFKNLNVSVCRSGADGGTVFRRCYAIADSNMPAQATHSGGVNGSFLALQSANSLAGDIHIEDCHYIRTGIGGSFVRDMVDNDGAPRPNGGFNVHISGSQWNNYPGDRDSHPSINYFMEGGNGGNPTDPGGVGDVDPPAPTPIGDIVTSGDNDLVLQGGGGGTVLSYYIGVVGAVTPGPNANIGDGTDSVEGGHIDGTVGGGFDDWVYDGEIAAIDLDSGVELLLNGHDVTDRVADVLAFYDADPNDIPSPTPSGTIHRYGIGIVGSVETDQTIDDKI